VIKKVNYTAKNIQFQPGSNKLVASSLKGLNDLAALMNNDPSLLLKIDGHSDNTGDAVKNKQLSEKRAIAVVDYLVQHGIEASRLSTKGVGNKQMMYPDPQTEWQVSANRRIEIEVTGFAE